MDLRTVIVTGAARGIGLACARRFYADGWAVILVDRDERAGAAALEDVLGDVASGNAAGEGRHAVFVHADISDPLHVHNLMAETRASFGRVDGLVNNAGVVATGGIATLEPAEFDRVLATNLRGAFLVTRAVVRAMVEEIEARDDRSRLGQRPYFITNMSSVNDRLAIPDILAYVVSKGGLSAMTRALSLELAPLGIRVNAVAISCWP